MKNMPTIPVFPFNAKASQLPSFLEGQRNIRPRKEPFKLKRQRSRLRSKPVEERIDSAKIVSVDTSQCVSQATLRKICTELGWKAWKVPRQLGKCDIYWHSSQIENFAPFSSGGAVNKFPGMSDVLRKINLTRALANLKMLYPEEYDFYPRTWFLPHQYHEFCADVAFEKKIAKMDAKKAPAFIVKPDGGTQGDGIYLLKDPHDYGLKISNKGGVYHVVQEYISNPYLIDKMKFDLRIYVILLSLNPVKIHLSREGLARFCTVQYKEPTKKNINDSFMHLTNYSLNRHNSAYIHTDRLQDGSKRTLSSVMNRLSREGHDVYEVWADIEKVVLKTMLAVIPELNISHSFAISPDNKVQCFQLLGFDILLTEQLKPIILEVNASPSLCMTHDKEVSPGVYEDVPSIVDKHVKYPLLRESMLLVAPKDKIAFSQTQVEAIDSLIEESESSETFEEHEIGSTSSDRPTYLYELYPGKYEKTYSKLRILERLASLYKMSLGLHDLFLTANNFRLFARRCCLIHQSSSLTVAALDILFMEIQRRWSEVNPDVQVGLTFQAFIEAFVHLAKRSKLRSSNYLEMVENMLDYCEVNLQYSSKKRLYRAKLPKIPVRYPQRIQSAKPLSEHVASHRE